MAKYINTGDVSGGGNKRADKGKAKGIKILTLYSFSHGVTFFVTYLLTNNESSSEEGYGREMGSDFVRALNKNSFLSMVSQLNFYSCRTGIGVNGEDVTKTGPLIEHSLD